MDYVRGPSFFPVRLKDSENLNNPFLHTERKKHGRTAEGQEESFPRTAYPHHFTLFVGNPDATRYTVVEKLQFEHSKS